MAQSCSRCSMQCPVTAPVRTAMQCPCDTRLPLYQCTNHAGVQLPGRSSCNMLMLPCACAWQQSVCHSSPCPARIALVRKQGSL